MNGLRSIAVKVKDVMHKGATYIAPDTLVSEIAKRISDADVGAIPAKADGHLVGIVTDRDITCRALADGKDPGRITAKDVMTSEVVYCSPEDDIAKAIKTMESKRVRRLPVTDSDQNVVGVVSLGDISHKVGKEQSGELLRAVSAHHR
jgi:CBS domain-containing protein